MDSIYKSQQEIQLLELADKLLQPLGFLIVDVDVKLGMRTLVRVFLERPGAGASIDDCAEASRVLGPALDEAKWLPGSYDLEVSSPGLDRRLRRLEDFRSVEGQKVKLDLLNAIDENNTRHLSGILQQVNPENVVVQVDGRPRTAALSNITKAVRIWSFE